MYDPKCLMFLGVKYDYDSAQLHKKTYLGHPSVCTHQGMKSGASAMHLMFTFGLLPYKNVKYNNQEFQFFLKFDL